MVDMPTRTIEEVGVVVGIEYMLIMIMTDAVFGWWW
jgi:hypothetical protein